jgi:hypothetical protein
MLGAITLKTTHGTSQWYRFRVRIFNAGKSNFRTGLYRSTDAENRAERCEWLRYHRRWLADDTELSLGSGTLSMVAL